MSSSLTSDNDYSFNIDELLHIGTMCKELRKEKDVLQESQSNSVERIRRLEMDVRLLSEARSADRKYIQNLERELRNCSQEIGYLQDQLSLRNIEANCLGEHVHSLELKLAEARKLHEKASQLRVELVKSESEQFFLMQELENKELELQNSNLCIEKLEEEISSIALESECEIESMKLNLTGMEQRSVEAKKVQEQTAQEKATMDGLIEGFELQFQDAQKRVRCLEEENRELRETLQSLERISRVYCQKVEEDHSGEWLENKEKYGTQCSSNKLGLELQVSNETGTCEEDLAPLLSRLAVIAETDENIKDEMKKMSRQILEYELLVKQLKDELREEKSKAKEEAEDLTQEMAELRYQITGMLEQECKRRACIEQASLQRIAELEAQVQKEQKNSSIAARNFREVQRLAESRSKEVHHLRSVLEGLRVNLQRTKGCSCGQCVISRNLFENCLDKELVQSENTEELVSTDDERLSPLALPWISEETRDQIGRETPDQHHPD